MILHHTPVMRMQCGAATLLRTLTSLCQQKVEKTMPTYVQGTVIPEISDLMNRRSDSGKMGILFRFHGSFEYAFNGCVSIVGIALITSKVRTESGTGHQFSLPSMCCRVHVRAVLDLDRLIR
jgi:hypothetical protein